MTPYQIVKTLHILSACILFGTGIGIAFFMLRSYFTDNLQEKFYAAKTTVLADYIFTLPAVIIQPLTGIWLVATAGFDPHSLWLSASYVLYLIIGACWLPVVWLQIQMKKMLTHAMTTNTTLPDQYRRYFRLWFILGWPAFICLIGIFWLMVTKPV